MDERIFTFTNEGDFEQHRVYKVDSKEADRLTEAGVATRIQLGEYDNYRKKAQELTQQFKVAERKIKETDDPRYTDEVKQYELNKIKAQYQADSKALDEEYQAYREKAIEEARTKSARAKVVVTESDKQVAEQLANRLALSAQTAISEEAKAQFIAEAAENIKRLSDEEKTALQGYIGKVLDKLSESQHQQKLIREVNDIRILDLLSSKVAEQLPPTATIEYNRMKIIRNGKQVSTKRN